MRSDDRDGGGATSVAVLFELLNQHETDPATYGVPRWRNEGVIGDPAAWRAWRAAQCEELIACQHRRNTGRVLVRMPEQESPMIADPCPAARDKSRKAGMLYDNSATKMLRNGQVRLFGRLQLADGPWQAIDPAVAQLLARVTKPGEVFDPFRWEGGGRVYWYVHSCAPSGLPLDMAMGMFCGAELARVLGFSRLLDEMGEVRPKYWNALMLHLGSLFDASGALMPGPCLDLLRRKLEAGHLVPVGSFDLAAPSRDDVVRLPLPMEPDDAAPAESNDTRKQFTSADEKRLKARMLQLGAEHHKLWKCDFYSQAKAEFPTMAAAAFDRCWDGVRAEYPKKLGIGRRPKIK